MAELMAYFAVKSISMSRTGGRKPCSLLEAARHNLREIQAEQGAKGHIDPKRIRHNIILAGAATAAGVQAFANSLLEAVDTGKLKKDHCQAIEALFSLPASCNVDPQSYFERCLEWLGVALPLPVLSAVIHRDEGAEHLHVLLLPIKDGKRIGSSPIEKVPLKRLCDSFFSQVAGPAGLKRDSAKLRGVVKQWAIGAVLRQCAAMGLPEANGPLWPVLVASIERDPTAAMLALSIDVNSIRPAEESSPIGLVQSPIGLSNQGGNMQALSCVGLHQQTPLTEPTKAIEAVPDLWAVAGCRSQWKVPRVRRNVAREAQHQAITRTAKRMPAKSLPPTVDSEGFTRIRDEYVHDLSAWEQ